MSRARLAIGAGAAALVLGAALWAGARFMRPAEPAAPVELFFPNNVSAAARIADFKGALGRHWRTRGRDDTQDAVEQFLRAIGLWDAWVNEYGERGARTRIEGYQSALFHLMGSEGWIVFGEWAAPGLEGSGETALLVFVRADSPVTSRIGPLADLLLPGHKVKTSKYLNETIYEYLDAEQRRTMTLARLGGWICASTRTASTKPLETMIDRYYEARRTQAAPAPFFKGEEAAENKAAVAAIFRPQMLWGQLRRFNQLREKSTSPESEDFVTNWAQRLERIEEIEVRQVGQSMLNLDLTLRGERIRTLSAVEIDTASQVFGAPFVDEAPPVGGPCILEADFSHPFIYEAVSIIGYDWDDILDGLDGAKWFSGSVVNRLEKLLEAKERPTGGRLGISLWPATGLPIPVITTWHDAPPLMPVEGSPGPVWSALAPSEADARGDMVYTAGVSPAGAFGEGATTSTLVRAERGLAETVWDASADPPLAYVIVNLDQVRGWMNEFPTMLLKSDDRERWRRYRSFVHAGELAAGAAALRLDRRGDELKLMLRTLEEPGKTRH